MKPAELYASITAGIIKDLEAGVAPWVKPWQTKSGGIMPRNYATKRYYSGINVVILWDSQMKHGYPTSEWLTYKQARAIGAQVRGGEKSTRVLYTNKLLVGEGEEEKLVGYMKMFYVFNVAQIDELTHVNLIPQPEITPKERDSRAATFIRATNADIRHGGDHAFYRIKDDFVQLPELSAFESYGHYVATVLHELCHWTGHEKRLARDFKHRFGTKEYAAEELVAELGAAFLCAHLGVQGQLRHAEYIKSWLELLKEDDRAVVTAASKASVAADYLRRFSEAMEEAA